MKTLIITAFVFLTSLTTTDLPYNSGQHCDHPAEIEGSGCVYEFSTTWDRVKVQVKAGPEGNCENNPTITTLSFTQKGQIRTVNAHFNMCYRREANPGSNDGRWGNWVYVSCPFDDGRKKKVYVQ